MCYPAPDLPEMHSRYAFFLFCIQLLLCGARSLAAGVHVMHQLHVSKHVVLTVERRVTNLAIPLGLTKVHGSLVSEKVGAQTKRKSTLLASIWAFSIMYRADMRLEMRFCLEMEATSLTGELPHLLVNNLRTNKRRVKGNHI